VQSKTLVDIVQLESSRKLGDPEDHERIGERRI